MKRLTRIAAAPAMVAALSLSAAPASAAELPVRSVVSMPYVSADWGSDDTSSYHGRRWGHRRYHRHRRGRVDAGDVLAGVLILGGIAAVANAANRNRDDRRYRDVRYRDRNFRDSDARGIDRAVSLCVREIERAVRVDRVDSVDRDASGWRVAGVLYDGAGFTCSIDERGRVSDVDYGRGGSRYNDPFEASAPRGDDRQHSDDRYRAAWASADGDPAARVTSDPAPAYPGGPLPGEDARIDGDLAAAEIGTGYQGRGD